MKNTKLWIFGALLLMLAVLSMPVSAADPVNVDALGTVGTTLSFSVTGAIPTQTFALGDNLFTDSTVHLISGGNTAFTIGAKDARGGGGAQLGKMCKWSGTAYLDPYECLTNKFQVKNSAAVYSDLSDVTLVQIASHAAGSYDDVPLFKQNVALTDPAGNYKMTVTFMATAV